MVWNMDKRCIEENDISKYVHKETKDKEKMCKDGKTQNTSKVKNVKIPEAMDEFMREIAEWEQWKNRIIFIKERAFLLPENCPDFKGLRVVHYGIYLGDCLKKRFEPSQALAMALKPEEDKRSGSFKAEDICVEKYLRGETVDIEDAGLNGWTLFCVDDISTWLGQMQSWPIKE